MSSYKILCAWLNSHEDFIKSKGFKINQIKKYVKTKLMDSEKVLRVLEKKYTKYANKQNVLQLFGDFKKCSYLCSVQSTNLINYGELQQQNKERRRHEGL